MLQLRSKNAIMIKIQPIKDAAEGVLLVRSQSATPTMMMVRRAATEDRTGDVRDIRTRKEPENAAYG